MLFSPHIIQYNQKAQAGKRKQTNKQNKILLARKNSFQFHTGVKTVYIILRLFTPLYYLIRPMLYEFTTLARNKKLEINITADCISETSFYQM